MIRFTGCARHWHPSGGSCAQPALPEAPVLRDLGTVATASGEAKGHIVAEQGAVRRVGAVKLKKFASAESGGKCRKAPDVWPTMM
jgi:hypothetical protein